MSSLVSKGCSSVRSIGVRSFATNACWTDMLTSKNAFIGFVNSTVNNPSGPEAAEMHKFLVKCFIDNDSDYDGLVSYKGFNNMIQQAALAPRRFGFAPHTRELYETAEEFEAERTALFNQLDEGGLGRITLESWLQWANAHIRAKDVNLEEHTTSRWSRSKADFVSFCKGVTKDSSSKCKKSSSSTQYKEFYILTNRMFTAADVSHKGLLTKVEFENLVHRADSIPKRFGYDGWYSNSDFDELAVNGTVSWMTFFNYSLNVLKSKVPSL